MIWTPKDTQERLFRTHSHSTHPITTISHKNNFTHSHTHAHTCNTQTPSMHPTHSNNSIQTHKHHSASSFHFISIQPIPSITKLKNSTTNNIPPSLLISTFTLSNTPFHSHSHLFYSPHQHQKIPPICLLKFHLVAEIQHHS